MTVLLFDGHNFLHRARAGLNEGPYSLVYSFFRSLRAQVELMQKQYGPINRISFVIEGHPKHRFQLLETYKANRKIDETNVKEVSAKAEFHRQKNIILDILKKYFPISVIRHPDHECDDVIYNIVANGPTSTQFVVVSNDTDYIQLVQKHSNCTVWNPMQKCEVVAPTEYDYVSWKSLVGDGSDNIPGIPGVGPKTAEKLLTIEGRLKQFFNENSSRADIFLRNHKLISFYRMSDVELLDTTSTNCTRNWEQLHNIFCDYGFNSIINDKSWKKFVSTFDHLWVTENEKE